MTLLNKGHNFEKLQSTLLALQPSLSGISLLRSVSHISFHHTCIRLVGSWPFFIYLFIIICCVVGFWRATHIFESHLAVLPRAIWKSNVFFLVWGGPYSPIQAASFLVNLREKTLSLSVPRNVRNVLSKRFFFCVCVVGESFLTFVFIYLRLDFVDVLKAFSFKNKKKGKITFYARLG